MSVAYVCFGQALWNGNNTKETHDTVMCEWYNGYVLNGSV